MDSSTWIILGAFVVGIIAVPAKAIFAKISSRRKATEEEITKRYQEVPKDAIDRSCSPETEEHIERLMDLNSPVRDREAIAKHLKELREDGFTYPPARSFFWRPDVYEEYNNHIRILPSAPDGIFGDSVLRHCPTFVQKNQHYLDSGNTVQCSKPCPICSFHEELTTAFYEEDDGGKRRELKGYVEKTKPVPRYYYNILRRDTDEVALWSCGASVQRQLEDYAAKRGNSCTDVKEGCDIRIVAEGQYRRHKVTFYPESPLERNEEDVDWYLANMWDLERVVQEYEPVNARDNLDKFIRKNNIELPGNTKVTLNLSNELFEAIRKRACGQAITGYIGKLIEADLNKPLDFRRSCKRCNKKFTPISVDQKYCGVDCAFGGPKTKQYRCRRCHKDFSSAEPKSLCVICTTSTERTDWDVPQRVMSAKSQEEEREILYYNTGEKVIASKPIENLNELF